MAIRPAPILKDMIIMTDFASLGLAEPIMKALAAKGYANPTPIQLQAIPPVMEGSDLCGIAQTGTGKTAAFALPALDYLARNPGPPPKRSARVLVLSPTRELAAQIAESFRDYGRFMRLSIATVFGGVPIQKQVRAMVSGVDVLVATPGRLLDLVEQRAVHLKGAEIFVLDEADQMMDLGFVQPLRRIHALLPEQRQSLFFSATMPKAIAELGDSFLSNPVKVSVTPAATTAERVSQAVTFVTQREKPALLVMALKSQEIDRALVFTRTKHGADRVVRQLSACGIMSAAIHGNKSQAQRTTALQAFRDGRVRILIATDIAARGIDVSGVSHVFNYELPNVPDQYVHRIGRTARAGAEGIAISFCAPDEKSYLRDIERLTRIKLDPVPLPENFVAQVASMPKPAPEAPVVEQRHSRGGDRGERGSRGPRGDRRPAQRPARRNEAPFESREAREGRPAARPEHRAEHRTERRPEGGFGRHNDARNENRIEHRGEPRGDFRREPRPDDRAGEGRRFEARGEGRPQGRPDNRGNARPEHRGEPRAEHRGDHRAEGRFAPRGDNRNDSRFDNRPARPRDGAGREAPAREGTAGDRPRGNFGRRGPVGAHRGKVTRTR